MPELPEVEITRRGIEPFIRGEVATGAILRERRLRWLVPDDLAARITGKRIEQVLRRGKYILLDCGGGWLILHLGMSGSLRVIETALAPEKHDHIDLQFGRYSLRLRDPRRFGAVLWHEGSPHTHPLLASLGVEPLSNDFSGAFLHSATRSRDIGIKQLLMNHNVVVGVGNIYANESLFRAGIHPGLRAGRLSRERAGRLVEAVRGTLRDALDAGGSSLRDFVHSDGSSGYFQQNYFVYDRADEPCRACGMAVRTVRMGQRSTFFCSGCQKR
jgi:formamidopyrimidine-DNA glycosylase